MKFVGGPLDGESRDDGVSLTAEGYYLVKCADGPLTQSWAVHDSISPDAAPRAIRNVVANDHNALLRARKQPLYASVENVNIIHQKLTALWMEAEFRGVVIEAGISPLKPLTQGHFKGWIKAWAKSL